MNRARQPGRYTRGRWLRPSALLVFGLQLVGGVTAVAHAVQSSGSPVAHVEAPGNESCPAAHGHVACQTCRVLSAPAVTAAAPRVPVLDGVAYFPPSVAAARAVPAHRSALGARAPPLA